MPTTPKTTIYIQAIITTDAVPDFSFFNKLANIQNQANLESAPKEISTLLTEVANQQTVPMKQPTSIVKSPISAEAPENATMKQQSALPVKKTQAPPKFSGEREGDPNKPITERQIGLVKNLIRQGTAKLHEIQKSYHVSDLPELTDADVQKILRDSKKKSNPDFF